MIFFQLGLRGMPLISMSVTAPIPVESFCCVETWIHVRLDVDDTLYPVTSGFSDHRNGEAPGVMLGSICPHHP